MKKVTVFLFAFSVTALLKAQTTLTPNQQAVKQTVINMFDALSAKDSVRLKLYCTNDITLYEYGMVWNMDSLIYKAITINTAGDFKRVNTFDFSSITVDKKNAWATYRLHSEINSDGKLRSLQWIETVILVKDKKRWKIKLLHSTLTKKN